MPDDELGTDASLRSIFRERATLMNIAFRMLGSTHDAEDIVQEAYARWYAMSDEARRAIESPAAWLVRVTSRICLDYCQVESLLCLQVIARSDARSAPGRKAAEVEAGESQVG